jgi:hypothetical protein
MADGRCELPNVYKNGKLVIIINIEFDNYLSPGIHFAHFYQYSFSFFASLGTAVDTCSSHIAAIRAYSEETIIITGELTAFCALINGCISSLMTIRTHRIFLHSCLELKV